MKVIKLPENGTNFVDYEISGKSIDFGDGEMSFRVDKKERDYEVTIDICQDYTGGLVMGASAGDKYVAQLTIPAREYTETEKENRIIIRMQKWEPNSQLLWNANRFLFLWTNAH